MSDCESHIVPAATEPEAEPIPVEDVLALQAIGMGHIRQQIGLRRLVRSNRLTSEIIEYIDFRPEWKRREPPTGIHRIAVFNSGFRIPAVQEGYDTYLGLSVGRDPESRLTSSRRMKMSLRTIPLLDDDAQPRAGADSVVSSWERYTFKWDKRATTCHMAWLDTNEYFHVFPAKVAELSGIDHERRAVLPADMDRLREMLGNLVAATALTPEEQYEVLLLQDDALAS